METLTKTRYRNQQWFCEYCDYNKALEKGKHCNTKECDTAKDLGISALNDPDLPENYSNYSNAF